MVSSCCLIIKRKVLLQGFLASQTFQRKNASNRTAIHKMADAGVEQFTSVTGASKEQAAFYLESAGGNVEAAIDSFFNTGGADTHNLIDDEGPSDAHLASVPSTGAIVTLTIAMHALPFCDTASTTKQTALTMCLHRIALPGPVCDIMP